MKNKNGYLLPAVFAGFSVLLFFFSCRHDPLISSNIPVICFEKEVLPIFKNNCSMTGCHDGTGETDLLLNSYVPISHEVVPYDPLGSKVYQAIIARSGENKMPPDKPLSLVNRTIIRLWIEQGAKLTICPDSISPLSDYVNPRACFTRDILPVLISSCAMTGCHDAVSHVEGYVFASYSTTLGSVSPGSPVNSKLYQVITTLSGESRMPPLPKSRLTQVQIDSIAAWIRYGALDEFCGEVCDTINPVTFSGTIWPVIQASCTGCHSGTSPGAGILLTNYSNVQTVAANGRLMNSLKGNGVPKMPPAGSLSACRIKQFNIWVTNGYLNN
ncbi:MAG: hypothetical protein C0408_05370 [Odoribacter sp.]|nr:hypothetical protein [Odoribacter sp.]